MADRLLKRLIHERFLVTLHDDTTFDGLLADVDPTVIRLVNVAAVTSTSRVDINGDVLIERANIAYMQKPRG